MQYTTNYSLKKPQYADEADIEIINDNTDDVDSLIHQNRTMIAPAFDNTKAYVTGDPVEYLGALYVFIADKAAGAWDASKVEPTTAAEMGGGGARALADLDDVEITSPTQGQALLFDDDDDVWKNQDLPDHPVTKEASGNPIEITDGASAPLVKCVSAITGSQDLHGYSKPWVGGAGVNKYDETSYPLTDGKYINYNSGIIGDSANFKATLAGIPVSTYRGQTLYCNHTVTGGVPGLSFYDENDDYISGQKNFPVVVPNNAVYLRFTLDVNDTNVMLAITFISSSTPYSPYSNICPITAYNQSTISVEDENEVVQQTSTATFSNSIYQGNADFIGGKATADWVFLEISNATYIGRNSSKSYYIFTRAGEFKPSRVCYSNKFRGSMEQLPGDCFINVNGTIRFNTVNEYASVTDMLADIGSIQFAAELNVSETNQVTPTNLPIKSLFGYNHIESSTGEMEIEYITEGEQPIIDLIEKSSHIYSTQEQAVGTWIDGKTMYERTFHFENPTKTTVGGVYAYTNVLSGDYDYFEVVSNVAYESNDDRYYGLPCFRITSSETLYTQYYRDSNGSIQASVFTGDSSWTFADIYLTIRYTKSSSNNRSLSKGGGEQEVKEEPTEETKEEPKEETKEENENNEAER